MRFGLGIFLLAQEQSVNGGFSGVVDSAAKTPISKVVLIVAVLTVLRLLIAPMIQKTPPDKRFNLYTLLRLANEIMDAVVYAGVFVFMVIRPFVVQAFFIPSGSMWPTIYVHDFVVANKAVYRYTDPKVNDVVIFRPPYPATYQHPEELDPDGTVNADFIKRCMGAPGDLVEIKDGVVYRNGVKVADPNKRYSSTTDYVNFTELTADEVQRMPKSNFKLINWKNHLIPLNYTATSANAATYEAIDGQVLYSVAPEYLIPDPNDQIAAMKLPAQRIPKGYYLMMGDNRNNSFDGRGWGLVPRANIIGRSEFIWFPLDRIRATR